MFIVKSGLLIINKANIVNKSHFKGFLNIIQNNDIIEGKSHQIHYLV